MPALRRPLSPWRFFLSTYVREILSPGAISSVLLSSDVVKSFSTGMMVWPSASMTVIFLAETSLPAKSTKF